MKQINVFLELHTRAGTEDLHLMERKMGKPDAGTIFQTCGGYLVDSKATKEYKCKKLN